MSEQAEPGFLRRRILDPLLAQLKQGVTPQRLALSCALGTALGIFPLLGTTTALCFVVGIALKLNQPAIQTVNYVAYPAQLAMLPVFVRVGEKIFNAAPVTMNPIQITKDFAQSPATFLSKYGLAGFHGVIAWTLIAPLVAASLYFPLTYVFQKMGGSYARANNA